MKNKILFLFLLMPFIFSCSSEQAQEKPETQQIPKEAINPVKAKNGDSYYFLQYTYAAEEETPGEVYYLLYRYDIKNKKQSELVKKGELIGAFQNDGIDSAKLQYDPINERIYFEVAEFATSGAAYYWDINTQKIIKLFDAEFVGVEADGSVVLVYSDVDIKVGRYFQTILVDKNGKKLKDIGARRTLE